VLGIKRSRTARKVGDGHRGAEQHPTRRRTDEIGMWQRWRCSRPIASTRSAHLRPATADAWSIEMSAFHSARPFGVWLIGAVQELAGVVRVPGADDNVVGPHGSQAVTCPGPAVGQPRHALDAGATQERAEQLGLGLATGDLNYDPVVGASHRRPPNSGPAGRRCRTRPLACRTAPCRAGRRR
jgi:hypothetical protein